MNKRNYQKELEAVLSQVIKESRVPRLLLHSCCAPCSSYVLEYLSQYFAITLFYYNPNITPRQEYDKRAAELVRLAAELAVRNPVDVVVADYQPEAFFALSKGLEDEPEGGARCLMCYRLRLEEAARMAQAGGYDYFATSLTISPMKDADKLNQIGEELSGIYQTNHLPSDFKKKNGYKRSVELSSEHQLYRQDYCGCVFSRLEQEARRKAAAKEAEE